MNWGIFFFIAIAIILMRVFWLRIKANSMESENFKALPPKDQLAVLKECLLNNPTETNLRNLGDFCKTHQIDADMESYRPYLAKQLEITKRKDAIAEDNDLYAQESAWMDAIRPLEFAEAKMAKDSGDTDLFTLRTIEGIARLYSDEAIQSELGDLGQTYPKAAKLLEGYRNLMEIRDSSGADDKSLENLRKKRDAWQEDLLTVEQ
ncbi:hypothetical protein [uncultured Fibrobacter sp.]|uniref:hypothetical protein n=1 Tax=uncultured Fibrobacter sp. TaxID=261512 RepID=UPI0025E11455|nr:hypothetical protein [uncultured Fibrobacter sp.]MBR3670964.1 hypothetical protein [Fibrobacter sp.]